MGSQNCARATSFVRRRFAQGEPRRLLQYELLLPFARWTQKSVVEGTRRHKGHKGVYFTAFFLQFFVPQCGWSSWGTTLFNGLCVDFLFVA